MKTESSPKSTARDMFPAGIVPEQLCPGRQWVQRITMSAAVHVLGCMQRGQLAPLPGLFLGAEDVQRLAEHLWLFRRAGALRDDLVWRMDHQELTAFAEVTLTAGIAEAMIVALDSGFDLNEWMKLRAKSVYHSIFSQTSGHPASTAILGARVESRCASGLSA